MSTGKAFQLARQMKGLSQKEVAERCDPPLDLSYYNKLEHDKIGVSPKMVARVAKALEVSVDFLDELARPSEDDLAKKIFTEILGNLIRSSNEPENWIKMINEIDWDDSAGWDWATFLPRFRQSERIPSNLRLDVISKILSMKLDEVEFINEVLELYSKRKRKESTKQKI